MTDMTGWKQVYNLDELITIATQVGISTAFEKFENLKMESLLQRHERRLYNTRELLRNYRGLKLHAKKAVYKARFSKKLKAIDILEDLDKSETELFIESIKKSSAKTYIIIAHIDRMLEVYKHLCEISKDEVELNKYKAIEDYYINPRKISIDKIAESMSYSGRQIERYIDDAISDLTGLIFGIDGISKR